MPRFYRRDYYITLSTLNREKETQTIRSGKHERVSQETILLGPFCRKSNPIPAFSKLLLLHLSLTATHTQIYRQHTHSFTHFWP
jgi:hypothetical protein